MGSLPGRGPSGQFVRNNKCAVGNPGPWGQSAEMRRAWMACVTSKDVRALYKTIRDKAIKEGDMRAARLYAEISGLRAPMAIDMTLSDDRPRVIILPDNGMDRTRRRAIEAHVPGGPVPAGTGPPADEGG
jgi:hypothetical protein